MLAVFTTRRMPGPPYGSISTGSFVPGWCQDGKSTAVRMPVGPAAKNWGAGCGRFGRCASEAMFPVTAPSREIRTVRSLRCQRPAGKHGRPAGGRGGVHARLGRDRGEPGGSVPPDADLGGLRGPGEQHVVAVGADNRLYLQSWRGDRGGRGEFGRRGDDQAPRVAADPGPDDVTACQLGGHALDDVRPLRVGVLADHGAGDRVDDPHRLLVPGLHDEQQVLAPGGVDQVREDARVPAGHLGQPRARGRDDGERGLRDVHGVVLCRLRKRGDKQRHVRVGGSRGGVADLRRRLVRVGGVGDVPAGHAGLVHARDQELAAVW